METVKDLINVFQDFIDRELPKVRSETGGNRIDFCKAVCFINRSEMFSSLLTTSFDKLDEVIKNIEKII